MLSVKTLYTHTHTHSCHRPPCSPKSFHPFVCIHVCKALHIHDHPASCPPATGLGSVTSTATQKTYKQTNKHEYSRGLLDQSGKDSREEREEEDRIKKYRSMTGPAQQQILTIETAVHSSPMGLPEAPESGLCPCLGGTEGEDSLSGLTKSQAH